MTVRIKVWPNPHLIRFPPVKNKGHFFGSSPAKYQVYDWDNKEVGVISDMSQIGAVGHRVLHGGDKFTKSVLITPEVLDTFRPVIVNIDSQYVKNGITTWIKSWKVKGWKTADKKPPLKKKLAKYGGGGYTVI